MPLATITPPDRFRRLGLLAAASLLACAVLVVALIPREAGAVVGTITEFSDPATSPRDITVGADGNLWFAEQATDTIGRITTAGAITHFALPAPVAANNVHEITTGPDGNVWFSETTNNRIDRITPAGVVTAFTIPNPARLPRGVTTGPDGKIWFAESSAANSAIASLTTDMVTYLEFPVTAGRSPRQITTGPDGNIWFTENTAPGFFGKISTAGLSLMETATTTPSSVPVKIITGPDANLWLTEQAGNRVARVTPAGAITEFTSPTAASLPNGIATGADGNLYFTETNGNKIGVVTTAGAFPTEYPLLAGSNPVGITSGPDGFIWFTEATSNKIAKLQVLPAPAVTSVAPAAGPTGGGTTVTVTGTNFNAASQVMFGAAAAASFTLLNPTTIRAVSPPGPAGTVDITVTTPAGASSAAVADQFTYVTPPAVTSISPGAGPASGGTTVTIAGTNLNGATGVSFGAVAAASFSVTSSNSIQAVDPAEAAGIVEVTVATVGGTSATGAADQFTFVAQPTVASVSPGSGPTSGGTTVTITGANFNGATGVVFGGVAAASFTILSSTSIQAVTPAGAAGTVNVTVTTSGGISPSAAVDQFTFVTPALPTTGVLPGIWALAIALALTLCGVTVGSLVVRKKAGLSR